MALLLTLHGYCLNGFSKSLFSQIYLCSLGWHHFYKSSRLHCCCCWLILRSNFTVKICFFFSTGCLTVMHEEAPMSKYWPSFFPSWRSHCFELWHSLQKIILELRILLWSPVSLWHSAVNGIIEPYIPVVVLWISLSCRANNCSIFCFDGYVREV